MSILDLNALFHQYVEGNRFRPGIDVVEATPDLSSITVRLSFVSANTYCCAEPHCHLGTDLSTLRELAAKRGLNLAPKCVVTIHGVVERGAKFEAHAKLGLPLESEASEYDTVLFDGMWK